MNGIYYGLFGLAVLFIIRWYMASEASRGDVQGFFSRLNMRSPDEAAAKRSKGTPRRSDASHMVRGR